jgi:hypothetical protein
MPFYWDFQIEIEERTASELLAKYNDATNREATSQELIANLQRKYQAIQETLQQNVERARQHVNRLGQIAARPNPLSSVEYIDLLIQSEQGDKKPGWIKRVQYLRDVREMAEIGTGIAQDRPYTPPQWASYTNH